MDTREFINRFRMEAHRDARPVQTPGTPPAYERFMQRRGPAPGPWLDGYQMPVDERMRPQTEEEQRRAYEAAQRRQPDALGRQPEAYQEPRNQFAEAGQWALEQTGLPSVRRSARAFAEGDLRTGFSEGALGALGVGGMALGVRGAPQRPSVRPPLPARTPMPEAPQGALRPPAPDAGRGGGGSNAYRDALRAEGYDVDMPLYRGMSQPGDTFYPTTHPAYAQPAGISVSTAPYEANFYSRSGANGDWPINEGSIVYPVFGRGPYIEQDVFTKAAEELARSRGVEPAAVVEEVARNFRQEGYRGIRAGTEIRFFDAADLRPQHGTPPSNPGPRQ